MVTKIVKKIKKTSSETEDIEINDISKEAYVISQEIKIVKSLTTHDMIERNRQLRRLRKWLQIRSKSSFLLRDEDFLRLWKGLYYAMWMCDKPLNQENLADELGKLLHCFNDAKTSVGFFGAFLQTMRQEWFGIDQWRIDKMLMLVRRMFRSMFQVLKDNNWNDENIKLFNEKLSQNILLEQKVAIGLAMHVMDVFLEELGKIADGEIDGDTVALLIQPFVIYVATQKDVKLLECARNRVFFQLLWQSDLGREYTEKFDEWQKMGFPTGSIDALEKVEESESEAEENGVISDVQENDERNLDPRAGNVDVFIPVLPVNANKIINELEHIQYDNMTNTKSRKCIKIILNKYKRFESGDFPLGVKKIPKINLEPMKTLVDEKINNLKSLEDTLYGTTRTLKKFNKKKRKKLLSSIDFNELNEENYEEVLKKLITSKKRKNHFDDEWVVEEIPKNNDKIVNEQNEMVEKKKKQEKTSEKVEEENHNDTAISTSEWSVEILTPVRNDEILMNTITETDKKTSNSSTLDSVKVEDNNLSDSNKSKSEWDEPPKDGEVEIFVMSRKQILKQKRTSLDNNSKNLLPNPFSPSLNKQTHTEKFKKQLLLGKYMKKRQSLQNIDKTPLKSGATMSTPLKKVKIALQKNTIQHPAEYFRKVSSSPDVPFDATRKPSKSVLKPNLMPSPIDPFYQRKIGFKFQTNQSF